MILFDRLLGFEIEWIKGCRKKNLIRFLGKNPTIMGTILTIPSSAPTDLLAYAGQMVTDLWLVLVLAIGLPLAFYIIRRVVAVAKVK